MLQPGLQMVAADDRNELFFPLTIFLITNKKKIK